MTAGSDGLVKIYHFDNKDNAVIVIETTDETLVDACWIHENPNIVALCTAEGTVRLYDLADSAEKPRDTIVIPKTGLDTLVAIKSSGSQHALIVISKFSSIWSLSLGGDLEDDTFLLDKIYAA